MGLFHVDYGLVKDKIVETRKLADDGGDWDRRNRLKIHEAVNFMLKRKFTEATENFLSSVVTFTSYELLSYDRFIVLTVLISMLTLERTDLRKRVVLCPEVLSVIRGDQLIYDYLHSFYECDYKTFF